MRREIAFRATKTGITALVGAQAIRLGSALSSIHAQALPWGRRFGGAAGCGRRSATKRMTPLILLLLGLAFAPASVLAAPITGEAQPEISGDAPDPIPLQDPAPLPVGPSVGADADAMVTEFSIVPSASDPNKMETVIIVQQGGGKSICVPQGGGDIISRGYRRRGDLPFDPTVRSEIRGLSSGHSGELMGFNDFKVFIRPHSAADDFTDTNECFRVGEAEACFVGNGEDCDQVLREGDSLCIAGGISDSSCTVVGHANLMRKLRIIVALNQPASETPIITEAGVVAAPELELPTGEPEAPGQEPPAAPEGPTDEAEFGGGGVDLVAVPDVIGLTLSQASGIINGVGLVVGAVTIQNQQAGLRFPSLIRSAHAQDPDCTPGNVTDQDPNVDDDPVPEGTSVNLEVCPQFAAIPEPSSLGLFAVGLGLLILFAWSRRRPG